MRERKTFACLTCYDATTARWLERAGVPVLLVGDTAAEMILGFPNTLHAPLDFLILLTAAVKRGAPRTLVMADMPFMSYQVSDSEGVRNAGRFMTEGMCDAVKLEVDASFAPLVQLMTRAGVPVVAHIGSRPQHAKQIGGYIAAGKTAESALKILDDADAMLDLATRHGVPAQIVGTAGGERIHVSAGAAVASLALAEASAIHAATLPELIGAA